MIITAKGNQLDLKEPGIITQGSIGQKLYIELSPEWNNLTATAIFSSGGVKRDVIILESEITIPWELLVEKGKNLLINLHGTKKDGTIVIRTNILPLGVVLPTNAPSDIEPIEPNASRLDQVQELAKRAQRMAAVALGYAPKSPTIVDDTPTEGSENFVSSSGVQKSLFRKNLLDNWYFGNPINQRGQKDYTSTGYGIDRWSIVVGTNNLIQSGLKINDTSPYGGVVRQPIDNPKELAGKKVTISAIVSSTMGGGHIALVQATGINSGLSEIAKVTTFSNGLISITASLPDTVGSSLYPYLLFEIATNDSVDDSNHIVFNAVKFELGDTQTLAHQENGVWVLNEIPDYGEELAKCQRYFQTYSTENLRPFFAADCRPVMRTDPAQGMIFIDGISYFVNIADY